MSRHVAGAQAIAKKRKSDSKRASAVAAGLEARLDSARRREDKAVAAAAEVAIERKGLLKRVGDAEAVAAARAAEAALATSALDNARQMEALWFEQREALLDETEVHRSPCACVSSV